MISAPDRRRACELIEEAQQAGARLEKACAELGLCARTYRRWKQDGEIKEDGRPKADRPVPRNKLTSEERNQVLETCHRPEFASLPPSQIVPRLADAGHYIASESTFYRVLRAADEQHHRGRSKAPERRAPASHQATGPCQVWSWDITYLSGPVKGQFFYLYLIMDVYSRKIVGWEVFDSESGEHAATVVQRAVRAEKCLNKPLVLHSDNGSPMKASTLQVTLDRLGVRPSHSRPRVSNDNAYAESLFRTCKYRPDFPVNGFADIQAAREWVYGFANWYNCTHLHSGINFVTPSDRHTGKEIETLSKRTAVYALAKASHPERWSGPTRNWSPVGDVWLNPEKRKCAARTEEAA